jgi:hypothetical protein
MARWQQAIPLESETEAEAPASNRWKSAIPLDEKRPKPVEADAYALSLLKQHADTHAPGGNRGAADIMQAQEQESRRRMTHQPQVESDPESENSPARLFLTPPEESLSKTERLIDATTAIPKGIVKGVAGDILGSVGDIYGLTKTGSDFIRDRLPLPEWYRNIEDKANEILSPVDGLFQQIPDSEEIIEGLKDIGVPLDRPKTRLGRYIESYERGASGFLSGPAKWAKQMLKLGGVSGTAGEAGEELSGSPLGRTAAQIGTLLLTPKLGYSNAGKLLNENMEFLTRPELRDAHRLVKDSHRIGFPLLGPEALPRGPIQGLAADTLASPTGGQLLGTLLKKRPEQVARIRDKLLGHFGVMPTSPFVTSAPPHVRELFDSTKPGTHDSIRTLATLNPHAFRGWVADYIERAYEGAAQDIRGASSLHSGWKFKESLVGTPQRKLNFEVMMEGLPLKVREEINTTLNVLGHSGKLKEIGETMGRERAKEVATRNDVSPLRLWWEGKKSQQGRERLTELDKRRRRTYLDLAEAMGSERTGLFPFNRILKGKRRYDPDTITKMLDLADVSPISPLTAKRLGLLLTGLRADNGWPVEAEELEAVSAE